MGLRKIGKLMFYSGMITTLSAFILGFYSINRIEKPFALVKLHHIEDRISSLEKELGGISGKEVATPEEKERCFEVQEEYLSCYSTLSKLMEDPAVRDYFFGVEESLYYPSILAMASTGCMLTGSALYALGRIVGKGKTK